MSGRSTLVGGIGNVFLGDDAFGVEVVSRLAGRPRHPGVHITDFGIRSLDLAYALLDDYDDVILVDAMPRGKPPGTLTVLEPSRGADPALGPAPGLAAHGFIPDQVLAVVAELGGPKAKRLRIVGCEPAEIPEHGDIRVGLSPVVADAVDRAVALVEELVEERSRDA